MKFVLLLAMALATGAWNAVTVAGSVAPTSSPVTFARDLAPLVFEHCAPCHRPGGVAPFPLTTYAELRARARQVVAAVSRRTMPPWKPEPGFGSFARSRRLSDDQVSVFAAWVAQGSVPGNPHDLPPLPRWTDEWQLGQPDLVLRLSAPFRLPPAGPDRIRNFVIPIPVTSRRFVKAWEFRTDSPQVVHHATMVLDPTPASRRLDAQDVEAGYEGLVPLSAQNPDGYFLGWTPGQAPAVSSDQLAWRVDPNTDLVLMLHLRPTGVWQMVTATVGLYFGETAPEQTPAMIRLNRQDIDIPAGEPRYSVSDSYTLPVDVDVLAVQPHAHNLAREVRGSARLPDGRTQPLIYIRDWDFHWQDNYQYAQPVPLPAGTVVTMEIVYDNSSRNRANPNYPARRVTYGQRTSDEMGDLWLQVVPRHAGDLPLLTADLRKKLLPQNVAGYRMMVAADPDNVGLHDDLALLQVESGDLPGAVAQFAESLRLGPTVPAAHYNLGKALVLLGRPEEAEARFRSALALNPDYSLAHQGLALLLDVDEAATHLEQAVRLTPTADAHYNLAVMRQRQGDLDAAAREYHEALRLVPTHADALFGLGRIDAARGRPASAVASLRLALSGARDVVAVQLELAWILATCADRSVRDAAAALALVDRAVALTPVASARPYDVRAAALAGVGRFDEAVASAQQALELLHPADASARAAVQERIVLYQSARPYVQQQPSLY